MTKIQKENRIQVSNCEIKGCNGKCLWVIKHDTRNAIFQYPLHTKQEAQTVLEFENLSGYHLEHHFKKGS
jgi:hypothetical protein